MAATKAFVSFLLTAYISLAEVSADPLNSRDIDRILSLSGVDDVWLHSSYDLQQCAQTNVLVLTFEKRRRKTYPL